MRGFGDTSTWDGFDCPGSTRRWRFVDGAIEVEGQGFPSRAWAPDVNQWADIIIAKAAKYQVPAVWVAAIMALETGGRPGLCRKNADGTCSTREGMGLMAMLLSTAAVYAGRSVSQQELLHDHDLQIDLGAKMLADLRQRWGGDYVKAAISYNAGRVRCGSGRTWEKPHEPCPATPWGVVMGCLRTPSAINPYCAPSSVQPGKFACPVDYPTVAIAYFNAAVEDGWTSTGHGAHSPLPGPEPEPFPGAKPIPRAAMGFAGTLSTFAIGVAVAYYGLRRGLPKLR